MYYRRYLVRKCNMGSDLDEIVSKKVDKNNEKYPVDKAYGSKEKYTELKGR